MATYHENSPLENDQSTDEADWVSIAYLNEDNTSKIIDTEVFYHLQPNTGLAGVSALTIDVAIPLAAIDYACDPEEDINVHFVGSGYEELNTERKKSLSKKDMEFLTKPKYLTS